MSSQNVLIIGATGMIGGTVLRRCLDNPRIAKVTSIGRRKTGIIDSKLREIKHTDYTNYSSIERYFEGHDVAYFCLGAYTGTVPDDEFRRITVDYTTAFAETLKANSPDATLCFLSGQGADLTEKSRISFAKYKGMAENALMTMGFPQLRIFRPGYIYPVTPRKEPNLSYRILRVLYPVISKIYPNIGVTSDALAQAMFDAGMQENGKKIDILENKDIRAMA